MRDTQNHDVKKVISKGETEWQNAERNGKNVEKLHFNQIFIPELTLCVRSYFESIY